MRVFLVKLVEKGGKVREASLFVYFSCELPQAPSCFSLEPTSSSPPKRHSNRAAFLSLSFSSLHVALKIKGNKLDLAALRSTKKRNPSSDSTLTPICDDNLLPLLQHGGHSQHAR